MEKRLLELNHSVVVLDTGISNIRQLQRRYPETLLPIVEDARKLSDIQNGVKQAAGRFGSNVHKKGSVRADFSLLYYGRSQWS